MTKKVLKLIITTLLIAFIIIWPIYTNYYREVDTKEDEEDSWKGVIRLWDFPRLDINTGSRYGWINDKIKMFERQNPGVYIELEPIDWENGPIKLEVALKTGSLPDIAPIGSDFECMSDDMLEPLDSYFTEDEKNQFKYQAIRSVTYNGEMIAVPFAMTTYAMYINLDLFRQRGVEPPIDGNWTYDEFIEKMKKLTWDDDGDGKNDYYGFMSFVKPNYYNIWGIILSDGAEILDQNSGEYIFYGEKALKGTQKIVDLRNKYNVTPKEFGYLDENNAWDMFAKGKRVAVYPTGSWAVNVLENNYLKGEGFDFAVANYPIGEMRIPISLNNGVSAYGIFKQQDKKKLDMCVKFLKFITNEENQRTLDKLGLFPVNKNVNDLYSNNEKMKRLEDCLYYTQIIPRHEKWKDIDRILQAQIRLAIIGEKTTQEALDEAKNQVEYLLKRK